LTLFPHRATAADPPYRPRPFPREGVRLPLCTDGRSVGWLDVWGNATPASAEHCRTLADVARIAAAVLVAPRSA